VPKEKKRGAAPPRDETRGKDLTVKSGEAGKKVKKGRGEWGEKDP